jgi:hypothetical protein
VVQVGGPTTFGPNPNMYLLRVHLADQHVPLTALQAGRRTVTPRVSVVNDGTSRAVHATVTITVPDGFGLTDVVGPVCSADTWQARSVSGGRQFWCDQGTLAPHSTVVLSPTFTVTGARLADYTAPPGGHTFGRVSVVASGVSLAGQTGVDTDLTFFIDY